MMQKCWVTTGEAGILCPTTSLLLSRKQADAIAASWVACGFPNGKNYACKVAVAEHGSQGPQIRTNHVELLQFAGTHVLVSVTALASSSLPDAQRIRCEFDLSPEWLHVKKLLGTAAQLQRLLVGNVLQQSDAFAVVLAGKQIGTARTNLLPTTKEGDAEHFYVSPQTQVELAFSDDTHANAMIGAETPNELLFEPRLWSEMCRIAESALDDGTGSLASNAVLVTGQSGTGKAAMASLLATKYAMYFVDVNAGELAAEGGVSMDYLLHEHMMRAIAFRPSVLLLRHIERLVPQPQQRMQSMYTDTEFGILAILKQFIDALRRGAIRRCVLVATASSAQRLHSYVRELFDQELVLGVPSTSERRRLLEVLMGSEAVNPDLVESSQGMILADMVQWRRVAQELDATSELPPADVYAKALVVMRQRGWSAVRSKFVTEVPEVSWESVAGHESVKQQILRTIVEPRRCGLYAKFNITPPTGILLFGPPGTGKTLVAKAVATNLRCTFLNLKLSEIISGSVGESEHTVFEAFATARQVAPCVIFIDEIQAIFTSREADNGSVVGPSLTSTLVQCLDDVTRWNKGSGASSLITVLAATNEPWALELSLLRTGRFEKTLYVGPLDAPGREQAFTLYWADHATPLADDVDVQSVVRQTNGFTGADIIALCKAAGIHAVKRAAEAGGDQPDRISITQADVSAALSQTQPSVPFDLAFKYQQWSPN